MKGYLKKLLEPQKINLYGFVLCCGLLSFAGYLQHVHGIEPCPLCIVQRVFVMLVGLVFFAGIFLKSGTHKMILFHNLLLIVTALGGVGVAGRQVYLQHLPEGMAPACGPSLDYMLKYLPIQDVVTTLFTGTGECSKVQWEFFGHTIPEWTLIFFASAVLMGIIGIIRRK